MALHLDLRQKQILETLFKASGWTTGRSLGAIVKVSDRTIRSDIRLLDKQLIKEHVYIQAVASKGYRLDNKGKKILSQLMEGINSTEDIPITPPERMIYYLSGLIFDNISLEIAFLEEQIFISHSTMEKDLMSLQNWLRTFDLSLLRDSGSITISGEESKIRYLMLYLLDWYDYRALSISKEHLDWMVYLYEQIDLFLKDCNDGFIISLSGEAFWRLKHLLVTLAFRLKQAMTIDPAYSKAYVHNSDKTSYCKQFLLDYFENLNLIISDYEKEWLEVAIKKFVLLGDDIRSVDTRLLSSVTKTIKKLEVAYGIALSEVSVREISKVIQKNISDHERLPFSVSTTVKQTEKGAPLAIEMTIDLFKVLMEAYKLTRNGDDFNQITTIISTEIEKTIARKEWVAKGLVIVSDADKFTNDYLLARMKRYFPMLNVTEIIPSHRYKEDKADNRLVFSTNTQLNSSKPVLMIHPMLKDYDRYRIKAFLHNTDSMHHMFVNLFREVLYFKDMDVKAPTDAIRMICDKSQDQGYGDKSLYYKTMEREAIKSTAIGNGLAIPHSMNPQINESVISVAILKNSITWGREKVRLVMLIQIAEKQKKMMEPIFGNLVNLVRSKQEIDALIHTNNYYEFIKILSQQTRRNDEL